MFDIHLGKWQDNPDFEYISVFKAREKQKVNGIAASTTLVDELFVVNLFYDRNKHKTFFKTYDKYEAFKVAQHFKLALDLDILDATEHERKWIN